VLVIEKAIPAGGVLRLNGKRHETARGLFAAFAAKHDLLAPETPATLAREATAIPTCNQVVSSAPSRRAVDDLVAWHNRKYCCNQWTQISI